jgi:hypothetical protein
MNLDKLTKHIETQDAWMFCEKMLLERGVNAYFLLHTSNHPFLETYWWKEINNVFEMSATKRFTLNIKVSNTNKKLINTLLMILLIETANRYPGMYELDYIKKVCEFPMYFDLKMLGQYAASCGKPYLELKIKELEGEIAEPEMIWNEPNPWTEFSIFGCD